MTHCPDANVPSSMTFRPATGDDIDRMKRLLFEHGPNEWNYLPRDEMSEHIDGLADGETCGYVAVADDSFIGLVTYIVCEEFARYEPTSLRGRPHGVIVEGVVKRQFVGQGIASRLVEHCKQALYDQGIQRIYAERHEENTASAATMRKAGFKELETFFDPTRRTSGSRNTTVCRFDFDSA